MDDVLKNLKKEKADLYLQGACQMAYSDLVFYPRWFCAFLIKILSLIALRDAAHRPI